MRLCNTPRQENLEIIIYNIKEHKPLHSKDENWPDSDPSKWSDGQYSCNRSETRRGLFPYSFLLVFLNAWTKRLRIKMLRYDYLLKSHLFDLFIACHKWSLWQMSIRLDQSRAGNHGWHD